MIRGIRLPAICTALLLAGAVPASAAKFEAQLSAGAVAEATDNQFRLSSEDQASFGSEMEPGEAFFGMENTSDLVLRLRLRGDLSWKIAKKRRVDLRLQATRYEHVRNSISDFTRGDLAIGIDLTRHDRLQLEIERIFDRFWKNYRVSG